MFRPTQMRIGGRPLCLSTSLIASSTRLHLLRTTSLRNSPLGSFNAFHNSARRLQTKKPDNEPKYKMVINPNGQPSSEWWDGSLYELILNFESVRVPKQYPKPGSVGIIGGGITGMMAAFWIKLLHPNIPVTILEKSDRLGGWIQTTKKEFEGQDIPMESGPRTFKSTGTSVAALFDAIRRLGLEQELLGVPDDSPPAKSRYIWLDSTLVRLPTLERKLEALKTVIKHPKLLKVVLEVIAETRRSRRDPAVLDETVGDFVNRRFGKTTRDLASAVIHGIYAGDINKLSMKSLFKKLWYAEEYGTSILLSVKNKEGLPFASVTEFNQELELRGHSKGPNLMVRQSTKKHKIFTFRNGSETLVKALEKELIRLGVTITKKRTIEELKQHPRTRNITAVGKDGRESHFTNVISTISGPALNEMLPESIPQLESMEAVTVQVVNLYFKTPNLNPPGFGYLIPQSTPANENPENALGVVFDSDSRNYSVPIEGYGSTPPEKIPGTLLTVMIGGHYWDGRTTYPSDEEAVINARAVVARHLGITEDPVLTQVSLQKDCITQYTLGHEERLGQIHDQLAEMFTCRLSVAGSGYSGVSIPDCMMNGRNVACGVLGYRPRMYEEGFTGLERYAGSKGEEYWSNLQMQERMLESIKIAEEVEASDITQEKRYRPKRLFAQRGRR